MRELKGLGLVSRFSVGRGFGEGRAPACWYLTKLSLAEIAEAKGVRASDLPWVPDSSYRTNLLLAHRLGVNAFFCALAEASRAHPGHCLATWRPEHWIRTRAAEVKPDGFGRYLHLEGACEFYLEFDRGTEAFGALARKLEGYLKLAAGWTKGAGASRVPEPNRPRSGGESRGRGRNRLPPRDRDPARLGCAREFVPAVRGERGSALALVREVSPGGSEHADLDEPVARQAAGSAPRPLPGHPMPRSLLHRRRSRPSASHIPRIRHAPIQRPAAPTCSLTPRRGNAPTEAELPGRRGSSGAVSECEPEQQDDRLNVSEERAGAEVDASLRPLARALLALAEQLQREEGP